MKNLKIPGLAALATAALMAFAGSASATTVTTTTGGAAATPTVHLVNEGGHVTFANPIWNISCGSTFGGSVESHGSEAPAKVGLTTFSLSGCTNSWHITTIVPGSLAVHWTSGHNGTVTWTGVRFESTRFGIKCIYETNNTHLGTITGGNPATVHIEASIPIDTEASSGLCGSSNAVWEGNYFTTSALYVAP